MQSSRVAKNLLVPGARVGGYRVVTADGERLVLRGDWRFAAGLFLLGLLLNAFGLMAWAAVLRGEGRQQHVSTRALFTPVFGLLATAVAQWMTTSDIDGARRALIIRTPWGQKERPAQQLSEVRVVILPTSLEQRETCEVTLRGPGDAVAAMIGRRRTTKTDAPALLAAAERIGQLLGLEVRCFGEMADAPEATKAAFETLRRLPAPAGQRPRDIAA